jgi:long-chain acyl-CoA synthetase
MTEFNSTLDAFLHWEKETPQNSFLTQYFEDYEHKFTYAEAGTEVRKMASYLLDLKFPEKSHIALLSKNCSHWLLADLAIAMAGYVSIPIYPTLDADGVKQILTHSEAKAIIIGKLDDFESQKEGIPNISVISINTYGLHIGSSWEDSVENASELLDFTMPQPEELQTIIYTSGTTGEPKGVMHTFANFSVSAKTMAGISTLSPHPKFFSYLPLAHVAERCAFNLILYYGGEFRFAHSLESFAENLMATQPDLFFAVPRIWGKFQEKILETIPQKKLSLLLSIPILNTVVKKKIKTKLGLAKASFIFSGAAPISADLQDWYAKIGLTILQIYGMTEDCCISHTNTPAYNKNGTVGKPVEGVTIKRSEDGEILLHNNCLFKGYYKAPEITAAVFDEDGYLKTGDIGDYDEDGYLTITGRSKDQFKTDKGKYISPSPIELQISKNTDIEQICLVGFGLPHPMALVTISVLGKAKSKVELTESLDQSLIEMNATIKKHELIEKIVVLAEEWNPSNGFTTPTLKIKRQSLEKVFQPSYQTWYHAEQSVVFEA